MCGIAGFFDSGLSLSESRHVIDKMTNSIKHRGEEIGEYYQNGPVSFGHVRLKIIDLSDNGTQPMTIGGLTVVFNGEIYNYLEIRQVLQTKNYSFRSDTDTEVILHAFSEWGEKCVDYFVGMWAFVIWDDRNKQLFCSRDRFGIKPFYYICDSGAFYFGSEYKPLKYSRFFDGKVNISQANRGLGLGIALYKENSYFEKIKILEPAHNMIFKNNSLTLRRYWDVTSVKTNSVTPEDRKHMFSSMFRESIRLQLRSDVAIGNCLSGGLDSSSIVSAISHFFPETAIKAFHIYYSGDSKHYVDEREFVNAVTEKYPKVETFFFTPDDDEVESSFQDLMFYSDVPVHGSSFMSQFFLTRLASQNGTVVLIDGQGADEYLAGYMYCFYPLLADLLRKYKPASAFRLFKSHVLRQNFNSKNAAMVFLKTMLTLLKNDSIIFNYDLGRVKDLITLKDEKSNVRLRLDKFSSSYFDNFLYNLTFSTSLPTLLHYGDRTSMAYAIESRVPFLDHRLVEFVFSTLYYDKINLSAETKNILRYSLSDVLPEKITNRKDKKGFVTPGEKIWLRGPLKHYLDVNYDALYWLDKNKTRNLIEQYKKGDNSHGKLIWNLCSLSQWMIKNT